MRLPRDLSAGDLITALRSFGYEATRQSGSQIRLTTQQGGEHLLTIPNHDSLRLGTLSGVLADVAEHLGLTRDQVLERLFGSGR
jgi:predicted RNA binding protein YcfA (HicA-like mRNA interferase family)